MIVAQQPRFARVTRDHDRRGLHVIDAVVDAPALFREAEAQGTRVARCHGHRRQSRQALGRPRVGHNRAAHSELHDVERRAVRDRMRRPMRVRCICGGRAHVVHRRESAGLHDREAAVRDRRKIDHEVDPLGR
jgi:hypothetical protein